MFRLTECFPPNYHHCFHNGSKLEYVKYIYIMKHFKTLRKLLLINVKFLKSILAINIAHDTHT